MLTALAGVITAITGLIIALDQLGLGAAGKTPREAPTVTSQQGSEPPTTPVSTAPERQAAPSGAGRQLPLNLEAGVETKWQGGLVHIQVLSARLEPYNSEKNLLRFTIRHINNDNYPQAFSASQYRLLVDGVRREPVLNPFFYEGVGGRSAKEGEIGFEVPIGVSKVLLEIIHFQETESIPFDLTSASP